MQRRRYIEKRICITALIFFMILSVPSALFATQSVTETKTQDKNTPALININTADISALCGLPGIGPKIAERIIKFRSENGPFKTTRDIRKVKGIGSKKYTRLKKLIIIN